MVLISFAGPTGAHLYFEIRTPKGNVNLLGKNLKV